MKSYTDMKQSNQLSEILPLDSADFAYLKIPNSSTQGFNYSDLPYFAKLIANREHTLPCWSMSALFNVLPEGTDVTKDKSDTENEKYMCAVLANDSLVTTFANNPVDVCVEMILKLDKLNQL